MLRPRTALAVVAAGALAVSVLHGRADGAMTFTRPAAAYHVVYRVESGAVASTEELWVNRPFESDEITYASGGDAAHPSLHVVSRLGRQYVAYGGAPNVIETGPQPAQFDQRLDAVAADAPKGAVELRGGRTVAGRRCRVVRTRGVLAADFIGTPTADDHVDSCVTADGIVLAQTTVANGRTTSTKTARRGAGGAAAVRGHVFATPGTHLARAQGGGRIVTVSDDSRPPGADFWELPAAPAGFTHLGRFAVVAPSPPTPATPSSNAPPAPVVTSIADVFVRGADTIVVEQGETLTSTAIAPQEGGAVDLGRIGHGRVLVSPIGSSVAALTKSRAGFVRVTGTVSPSRLVAVARALRAEPGGSLTVVTDLTSDGAA
ncbi:MAG: hypothetical protein QOK28_3212 [Actinomycetota bacterium]